MNAVARERRLPMFVRDHEWYIRHLMEHIHMKASDVVIVDDVATWCEEHGIVEKDPHKPIKFVNENGSGRRLLVTELIPDAVVEERIKASRIRSQLKSVGYDRADQLNSETKKFAYLVLQEYASSIPDLAGDDLASDEWVFEQMGQIGMFNP
jgi:hypothetical protein